jgi:hypothetical protein
MTIKYTKTVVLLTGNRKYDSEKLRVAMDKIQLTTVNFLPALRITEITVVLDGNDKLSGFVGYGRGNCNQNCTVETAIDAYMEQSSGFIARCYAADDDLDCLEPEISVIWEVLRDTDFIAYGNQGLKITCKNAGYFQSYPELYPKIIQERAKTESLCRLFGK